jgi:hypothetical protein
MSTLARPQTTDNPGLKYQVVEVDGEHHVSREIVVHEYTSDFFRIDSPEYLSGEKYEWILEHAIGKPHWLVYENPTTFTTTQRIVARLIERDITYFILRFA